VAILFVIHISCHLDGRSSKRNINFDLWRNISFHVTNERVMLMHLKHSLTFIMFSTKQYKNLNKDVLNN
jgi:hypothetical protein